jgi:2-amino-4-hydroxy-6-hydroxymethyldihydropteridine diphosphokinase
MSVSRTISLAFGGNLGEPIVAISRACEALRQAGLEALRLSPFYRTSPWGRIDQPDFVNACAIAKTRLTPHQLLSLTRSLEEAAGRERGPIWGPRILDIDLLSYEDIVLTTPELTLPHPRLLERAFVLVPLHDLAPDLIVSGHSIREALAALGPQEEFVRPI